MDNGIGKRFIELTKFRHLGPSDQMRGVGPPPLELPSDQGAASTDLPDPGGLEIPVTDLRRAIELRRSVRDYTNEPLTLDELSFLLWCTQGVEEVIPGVGTLRTVPSAGARHALETYLLVNRVTDVAPGLYRFLALEHRLVEFGRSPGIADRVTEGCLGQDMVRYSAAAFIWTAVPYRMNWRYGERGYRYLLLDAGHVCQNLYLAASAVGCGACAIAAFSDDDLNGLLGLDGVEQFVIYLATVGKR